MRVVITRHPGQAGALEAELRAGGCDVAFLPLTTQVPPADSTELTTATTRLAAAEFTWLLLTSANTIRALRAAGWDGAVPSETRIGVVGPGTARVLTELTGVTDVWMPQGESSTAGILAEFPAPSHPGEPVLLPQSARARPQLARGLGDLGWRVTQVSAYDTVPVENPEVQLLQPGDAVLITSSSAAEVWAGLEAPEVRVLAIGGPTAETLRKLGRPAAAVLPEPTAASVVETLRVNPG